MILPEWFYLLHAKAMMQSLERENDRRVVDDATANALGNVKSAVADVIG